MGIEKMFFLCSQYSSSGVEEMLVYTNFAQSPSGDAGTFSHGGCNSLEYYIFFHRSV